jgi:regulator of protease activity HflC (stomatin/prohibitin superfamily)
MRRYTTEEGDVRIGRIILDFVIAVIVLNLLLGSFGIVRAGQRGVHLRFGAVTGKIFDEGLYFKVPLIEKVVKMDVTIRKNEVLADSASKDLQGVTATIALNYHLDPLQVAKTYQEVRKEYEYRIISPTIQEAVKAGTAEFNAEELITKRPVVRESIKTLLREKLEERGIVVDEFNIVNFSFSQSFDQAIEAKVTAEQRALEAKNKLEQVKFEAQQKIAEAEGKAEAISIESRALRENPKILELRAIERWNGKLPQVTGGAVPFVNIK